jgi:hypothetical protein
MVWVGTLVLAYGVGYSDGRQIGRTAALIGTFAVVGLLIGGAVLMTQNSSYGAAVWIEDPEAADRWRQDLERERLKRFR